MPAINTGVLVKREENWAKQEAGVVVVFCLVFVIACIVAGVFISKKLTARKQRKAHTEAQGGK